MNWLGVFLHRRPALPAGDMSDPAEREAVAKRLDQHERRITHLELLLEAIMRRGRER